MRGKIVLVEDDQRLADLIATYLQSEYFEVSCVSRGDLALDTILAAQPDLVILDLMLPGKDGLEICQSLRPGFTRPIIMITAKNDDITEVSALNLGIDDFIAKPLRPHVLLARINALLRRRVFISEDGAAEELIRVRDLELNIPNRVALKNQSALELTDAEFDLLLIFLRNAGKVLNRDELFTSLRGIEYDGIDRSLDQRVCTLRKKLDDSEPPYKYIKSVRGQGYLFIKA